MTNHATPAPEPNAGRRSPQEVYYLRNQAVIVPAGYLAVGRAIGLHGLHGELKVELQTDFPDRFSPGVILYMGETLEPVTITQVREHKGHLLIRFKEIDGRMAAETRRNAWLYVDEADAVELDADTYWVHDIIGLTVLTTEGTRLGQITDVLVTGSNDVYVVHPEAGINQDRDVLVPALDDVVLQVDLEQHTMTVRLPDGLLVV